MLIRDTGTTSGGLACSATVPVLRMLLLKGMNLKISLINNNDV